MALRLRVATADGRRFEHAVDGEQLVVGRSSRAGLSISDRALSREHARLSSREGGWVVEDLGSHNGTRVNEVPISAPTRLRHGDAIGLGGSTLVVDLDDGEEPFASVVLRSAAEVLRTGEQAAGGRAAERLRLLTDVNQALARPISLEELLDLILDRVFATLSPQEVDVVLRDPSGQDVCVARRAAEGREHLPLRSRNLARRVIDEGMAAHVVDSVADERFAGAESLLDSGLRTFLAAPLLDGQGAIGMIVAGSGPKGRRYGEDDLELLVSLASAAALRIRNVALVAEALERQRLEQEIQLARSIQLALLPPFLPDVAGYDLHARTVPSRGVSGDLFRLVRRREGEDCALLVADVSGKGIAASLLTATLEALSAIALEGDEPPRAIFNRLSKLLFQRTLPEKFATAFLGVLSPGTGRLRYVNAGHNPPLLVRDGGRAEWLKATGVPLGLLAGALYREAETTLLPGDLLLVYTDGITEAASPEREEFGEERLLEAARQLAAAPLDALAQGVDLALERFARGVPFHDDRTLVVARRCR